MLGTRDNSIICKVHHFFESIIRFWMTGNQIEIMAFHYGLELGKKVAANEFGHSKQRLLGRVMAFNQTFISRSINIPIEDPDHLEV